MKLIVGNLLSGWSWEIISRECVPAFVPISEGMCTFFSTLISWKWRNTCILSFSSLELLENLETECQSNVDFIHVELGDEMVLFGDSLSAAISYANGSDRHPSLSGTKMLNPLLPCVFAPSHLNFSHCQAPWKSQGVGF